MGQGPGLRVVGVHAAEVGFCLMYLHGEDIVGLEGRDGAGRGGQSVSVMTRAEGTSFREGIGGVFGCGSVGVDMVRQW